MVKKLTSKSLDDVALSKVVEQFDPENYENTYEDEVFVTRVQLSNYVAAKQAQLNQLLIDSGVAAAQSEIDNAKNVIASLDCILHSRDFHDDDKICIQLTKDEVTSLIDANTGEETVQTEEVVCTTEFVYYDIKYRLASVDEYNELAGKNETEESYLYDLIHKLIDLSLTPAIRFAKKPLTDFVDEVRDDIISKNYEWHTLSSCLSISAVKFNKLFKEMTSEERMSLIGSHFVVVSTEEKRKSAVQGSLFDDVESTIVDLDVADLDVDGGVTDEQ